MSKLLINHHYKKRQVSLRNSLILSVRWHRRIGLLCMLFVLVLSVTGLLLNHTTSLKLDSIKINSPVLANLYGLPTPEPLALPIAGQWLAHDGINQLYLESTAISQCAAPLLGAVQLNGMLHVLCHEELLLLDSKSMLLERITPVLGLPSNTQALALIDKQLFLKTTDSIVIADLDSLQWLPTEITPEQWSAPQTPPSQLKQQLNASAPSIDLEQLLLDLHSGRLFGNLGVWAMDLVAILLIVLSITGVISWNSSRLIKKRR